ncbi:hypothetical protein JW756_01470 [Candidatus Woesearchaeota archaeon]|nr:hypothetical protein [Candidatus Woesearchaeota archaeon]
MVQDRVGNKRNDSKMFEIKPVYPAGCGDRKVNRSEECDDGNNIDGDGCSAYCKLESCGNKRIDAGEECESSNLNGQSCRTIGAFINGTLSCNSNCTFNVRNCISVNESGECGDYVLNDAELCDKNDWGSINDCKSFTAFIGGSLKCSADCHFDTSSCIVGANSSFNTSCFDSIKDGDETDVDCGGSCLGCADGKKCFVNEDCASYYCKAGICSAPSCTDGLQNGLESDVDCGASCPGCDINKSCNRDNDCISNFCHPTTKKCSVASCSDKFQNGDETDIDCGGGCSKKCETGQKCLSGNDCTSGICEAGICVVDKELDSDGDGMPDWWEDKYGLDKDNDDADENPDKDGCTNLDEYYEETDPTSEIPDCGSKNRTLQIILLIIGLLLMLGSAGFLVYYRKVLMPQKKTQPAGAGVQRPTQARAQQQLIQPRRLTPPAIAQKQGERKALLQGFDTTKVKSGIPAEQSKGAGAAIAAKAVGKEGEEEDFIPLSELGKKPGQAKEQKEEKTEKASQPKKDSSATFDKLKTLSDSYKKKKDSKK